MVSPNSGFVEGGSRAPLDVLPVRFIPFCATRDPAPHLHLSGECFSKAISLSLKVVPTLESEPEQLGGAEEAAPPQCGVRRDRANTMNDLVDSASDCCAARALRRRGLRILILVIEEECDNLVIALTP